MTYDRRPSRSVNVPLDGLHDEFIGSRLPTWLKQATQSQIRVLRDSLNAHHASQARLRGITLKLQSPMQYAEQQFASLLSETLPEGTSLSQLEWLQVYPRFPAFPGGVLPLPRYGQKRENGVLRLMRNFAEGSRFYLGTGLVAPGQEQVLSGASEKLVVACRTLDAGQRYQDELATLFDTKAQRLLRDDKRTGLRLAADVAVLKGEITEPVKDALHALVDKPSEPQTAQLAAYPGLFEALGCEVADGIWVQLRDDQGTAKGGVLYLPSDPVQVLRYFESHTAINHTLATQLSHASYRQAFAQLIGLEHRAAFMGTLKARLADEQTDLALEGRVQHDDVFEALAVQQIERVKENGKLLLVTTADADSAAVRERHEAWQRAGLEVLNFAGLFIPLVGGLLLGQLVAQTLGEVFEGAVDWSRGHQHEALEHMLGVAETLASTASTVAGVALARSAFVAALEPVRLANGAGRLWSSDLEPYICTPDKMALREDGTYGDGEHRWIKAGGCFYEVHRPDPEGPWRLLHPGRADAYGPIVLHNGERCWRLMLEAPQQWDDSAKMLETLWPHNPPVDNADAQRIMRMAGIDQDELRGLLMENRRAPTSLREALKAFDANARIDSFFSRLALDIASDEDLELFQWCENQPGVGHGRTNVLASRRQLSDSMFSHLTRQPVSTQPLLKPLMALGLPEPYACDLAEVASNQARQQFLDSGQLPLALAEKARSLRAVAKVSKALTGIYVPSAYCDETGMLVLALLDGESTDSFSLSLKKSVADAATLKTIGTAGQVADLRVLVRQRGVFNLYDGQGRALATNPPASPDIFDAVLAALDSPDMLHEVGLTTGATAQQLREKLVARLGTHEEIARLLGWAAQERWFNPGQRLPDGRVGYPLSDRPALPVTPREQLRAGLIRFFPGLAGSIEQQVDRWLLQQIPVAEVLMALEDDLTQLTRSIDRWVSADLSDQSRRRRLIGERLLRAWQGSGDQLSVGSSGQHPGLRLHLSDLSAGTLPELPGHIEFYHVTALVLKGATLREIANGFLQSFTYLQELDLSDNQLLRCPRELSYLTNLRRLRLGHNQIRLDAQSLDALNGLPRLSHLDLSHNSPLGAYGMRFHLLPQLVELNLRRCGLSEWPKGLELCGFLEKADLRDNFLQGVPTNILAMPLEFRKNLLVSGNRLTMTDFGKLNALDTLLEEPHAEVGRGWWVDSDSASPERGRLWDRLNADTENARFFDMLDLLQELSDFSWPKSQLVSMTWKFMATMDSDPEFAAKVQRAAESAGLDKPGVLDMYSNTLQLQAQHDAVADLRLHKGPGLLALGRALQRLDSLSTYVSEERLRLAETVEPQVLASLGLRYRTRLRARLKLPFQPARLPPDPNVIPLTGLRLQLAEDFVRQAEQLDPLTASLCRRAFWQRFLEHNFAQPFNNLDQLAAEQRSVLSGRRAELSEAQYLDEVRVLDVQLQVDRVALQRQLTRNYLISMDRALG